MRMGTLGALLALTAAAACGGASSGGIRPAGSERPGVQPTMSMTIPDGATLTRAVPWRVTARASSSDPVSEVDFLIDGKRLWVEHTPPYFFDDDHQLLAPWLLGAGAHTLAAQAHTVNGATAQTLAHVTVHAQLAADRRLAGTYHRAVTKADQRRARPYRVPSKGASGEPSPTGRWTLQIKSDGEVLVIDPSGDTSNPGVEPFTVSGSTMTLYGPAVWRQNNPGSPSLFCEPERPGAYTWSRSGSSLSIAGKQKVCADRDTVFVGTWRRS